MSFDFLWFGLGGFYGFPLVSFGFLRFPLVWILWFSFDSLRFSSVSFGLDSMVFLWFPLVSFGFQGKDKPTKESPRRL